MGHDRPSQHRALCGWRPDHGHRFWRIPIGVVMLLLFGWGRRDFFRIDRLGLMLVALVGGSLVAL